jgi:hypothetical protein
MYEGVPAFDGVGEYLTDLWIGKLRWIYSGQSWQEIPKDFSHWWHLSIQHKPLCLGNTCTNELFQANLYRIHCKNYRRAVLVPLVRAKGGVPYLTSQRFPCTRSCKRSEPFLRLVRQYGR